MSDGYDTWEAYFDPGEKLLWQGAPVSIVFPGFGGLFISAFGMPFFLAGWGMMVVSIAGMFGVSWDGFSGLGAGIFLFFFSIPFAVIGTGMVLGPWFSGPFSARRVRYALTDKRAYIAKNYYKRQMESYVISPGDPIELVQGRKADTVGFHVRHGRDSDGDRTTEKVAFENIADGEAVYHLIRKIQRGEI